MKTPREDRRYWASRTPENRRRAHSALRGQHTSDAVVIGGGLVGATAAYALAQAGIGVMLVEADRVATGATAGGLGAILPEPDTLFRTATEMRGAKVTRPAWHEAHRSAVEFASLLKKLKIKCDLATSSSLVNARTMDDAAALKKELTARKSGGVDTPWIIPTLVRRELGTDSEGALRLKGAATLDPVRAALGLIGAAEARGARVFEQSPVSRTTFTRKYADVIFTSGARIRTRLIFVATGEPGALFGQLRRHVRNQDGYVVVTEPLSAAMRKDVGPRTTMTLERRESSRRLRWIGDDRVLFAGAEQRCVSPALREKALIQRAGELLYELSVRYPVVSGIRAQWAWDVPIVSTLDGMPWIGPHRNYPFHFFAMALGWHADSLAWFAARAAVRQAEGTTKPEDDAFGFLRAI